MRLVLYSIRRRLLAWLLASTGVLGLLALSDTWREARETANEVSDRVLAGSALAIAERVVVAEDGSLEVDIPYVALEMLTSAAQDRVFYRVDGPPGTFITGYKNLPFLARYEGQPTAFFDSTFRGEPIRVATLARSASTGINSMPFMVTVAETTIARRQLTNSILLHSALRLLFLIVGATLIVWIAVTVSLRPLSRLGGAIAHRSPDDLAPIADRVPKEVQELVDTVNSFMVRLQSALDALRHFTGNASHQLRTPLAVIRTQLALATRATDLDEARRAALKADEAVADAERMLAQLLLMARIDATARARRDGFASIDLTELARATTAEHVVRAAEAGIDLGFEGEAPVMVKAEPLLLTELMKNLISNAVLYAGEGAVVTLRTSQTENEVILEVEDDGPGIPPGRRTQALTRFERGGWQDRPGSGLGLPIVEEVAALHGGSVELADGPGGRGLTVRVRFPSET
ncbi:sensor histidine kinase [Neorhizobium sp. JUb45]|uniref:sensor histidine kinase n=1 Tax=unclassified Neorhizobium TaxID=2629175 RepID=UPI001045D875|nr:sensor histidine kinase [Neorhizobium sp. JUb45]TCR04800.1 two-component system sensor histidine kinase TctE [Neorhizobium sp. JUb45]